MIDPLAGPVVQAIIAYVQDYSFVTWTGVVLFELLWMGMHPKQAFRGMGILALAIHNVIFYIAAINIRDGNFTFGSQASNGVVLTSWSAILRAHSGTTIIFLAIDRIEWKKVWEKCKELVEKINRLTGGWPWTGQ